MNERRNRICLLWRSDDTLRFWQDTPDKRGVPELVINSPRLPAFTIIAGSVAEVLVEL